MSRRSTLKRRRERKRRKHELRSKAAQLRPSTAKLFALIQAQTGILASIFAELEK